MNKIFAFSTHDFEKKSLIQFSQDHNLDLKYSSKRLDLNSVHLAKDATSVLCWAKDDLSGEVLERLYENGCRMLSLRSAGYSHLDFNKAKALGFTVARVPSYSPESIAEHAVALYLALNRKLLRASNRVREFDFRLDGLGGQQVFGKTIGVVGAGQIGKAFIRIMLGFGCKILIYDTHQDNEFKEHKNCMYVDLNKLLKESDVVSLHCPLNDDTYHIINKDNISLIKETSYLINTSRGGLVDTKALIDRLKQKKLKAVGLDVYEYEEQVFSKDYSESGVDDDNLARLVSFPNVLVTSHQAFFTDEAVENIARTSIENVAKFYTNSIDSEKLLYSINHKN